MRAARARRSSGSRVRGLADNDNKWWDVRDAEPRAELLSSYAQRTAEGGCPYVGIVARFRSFTTWSSTRCATSHFEVSGTSTTSLCEIIATAVRSESKPTPSRETSF